MKLDFFIFGKLVLGDDKGPSAAEKALAAVHLLFLHETGSNNPTGNPSDTDKIPLHPYYTIKDILGIQQLLNLNIAAHGTGCDRSTKKETERAMVIVNHYSNYNYIPRDTPIWYTLFFLHLQNQTGIWGLTIILQPKTLKVHEKEDTANSHFPLPTGPEAVGENE
eukprot:bmy_13638T0